MLRPLQAGTHRLRGSKDTDDAERQQESKRENLSKVDVSQ
jgi:hypothetical protein